LTLNPEGAEIVKERRKQQQAQEPIIPPPVEHVTRNDQHPVLAPVSQPEVEQQNDPEKDQER
jgi:hypothetical protein